MDMREVLEAMRLNGLHDEAAAVGIVMQQRSELLEALKVAEQYVQVYVGNSFFGANSKSDLSKIKEAITKAEATE